jgi:heme A synthase
MISRPTGSKKRFAEYAWLVLGCTVLVILWGTVVRGTNSGAGCGDHWPLCGGQVFPHAAQIATLIEFAHRLSSALIVVLVAGLILFAFRIFPRRDPVRRFAAAALFFTLTEGLIGAALVLLGDVGTNASASRVLILSVHLVNTFLLLGSLALTARSAGMEENEQDSTVSAWPAGRRLQVAYGLGLVAALAVAVSGTIAALADTLFHATSLVQAFQWDFSGGASPILRLRIVHPLLAVTVGTFLLLLAVHPLISPAPRAARRIAPYVIMLILFQFCLGTVNVLLLSPLWIQVLHLLTADLIWIAFVLLSAAMMRVPNWVLKPGVDEASELAYGSALLRNE